MEVNYIKLIETVVVMAIFFAVRFVVTKIIDRTLKDRLIQESRGLSIKKVLRSTLLLICMSIIFLIWGVDQSDLAIFIGSVVTIAGVAFFAQWSLLSNITSSIILFFNHPIKLNDKIVIMEGKDYAIEGKVTNIGLFFISIQTYDMEELTLPNNVFIQKTIKKLSSTNSVQSLTENEKN
ncbi:mechanosensitive ion channel domain-containing protein [Flagellimonas sp. S174]|uniref:mechanosensitive ion channel domain-containing protein n=1 Tax=Flagellimonas sp. S174 TaxID=3410790 RepID=UPI003BF4C371